MIGIDTNVLLRLIVRDNQLQLRAAERFVATHCTKEAPGFVSTVVIAEVAWVLGDFYGYDRPEIAGAVRGLLEVAELEVDCAREVDAAVQDYQRSSADFADCLIARLGTAAGCSHTITFDRKAAKLSGFKLLPI